MSAQETFDAFCASYLDVYIGPPDEVITDSGTQLKSKEFGDLCEQRGITLKIVPIEAHNAIGKGERYHGPLRRAFEIIDKEMAGLGVHESVILQMAVKAVNDSAGPKGLIPTLLVFGVFPKMFRGDLPAASVIQRSKAIRKAMDELRKVKAERQVTDALRMRHGPTGSYNLKIGQKVVVWREDGSWTGPFKLVAIHNQTCIVHTRSGPKHFRSNVVKPFNQKEFLDQPENVSPPQSADVPQATETSESRQPTVEDAPENEQDEDGEEEEDGFRSENEEEPAPRRNPKRSAPLPTRYANQLFQDIPHEWIETLVQTAKEEHDDDFLMFLEDQGLITEAFLTEQENSDRELAKDLRAKGIINTPGAPFEESTKAEIEGLMANDVFKIEKYNPETMGKERIFNARLVHNVKDKHTAAPFEKTRMVVQAFNDKGKAQILCQSPTIQKVSQRLILALGPSLAPQILLWLRDISQAYTQSKSRLNRLVIIRPPPEVRKILGMADDEVLICLKPLYGIPEAGTHWFATYIKHHLVNLDMEQSTYDPCLLISKTNSKGIFGLVGLQTDDTLILANKLFTDLEAEQLKSENLLAKERLQLTRTQSIDFNGSRLTQDAEGYGLTVMQKGQADKIELVDFTSPDYRQQYLVQRARGAYIGVNSQPEALYDLAVAAQHQDPDEGEVKALNKRLAWQRENKARGLHMIVLNLPRCRLYCFVDASHATNKDLSSQLGVVMILAEESTTADGEFRIRGNYVHGQSAKDRRVANSALAGEVHAFTLGIDIAICVTMTLKMITKQLGLAKIPLVICTDSLSLYECTVKLGTTHEKRLMIDIMGIRQAYDRQELAEIRWINGTNNPADHFTKAKPNSALSDFISTNELTVKVKGWVDRELDDRSEEKDE